MDKEQAMSLWKKSERPEVVDAVAFYLKFDVDGMGIPESIAMKASRIKAKTIISSVLTSLVGPDPREEEEMKNLEYSDLAKSETNDDDWLDKALDNFGWVPGEANIKEVYKKMDGTFRAVITTPGGTGTGFADEDCYEGIGKTRKEAILNAITKK